MPLAPGGRPSIRGLGNYANTAANAAQRAFREEQRYDARVSLSSWSSVRRVRRCGRDQPPELERRERSAVRSLRAGRGVHLRAGERLAPPRTRTPAIPPLPRRTGARGLPGLPAWSAGLPADMQPSRAHGVDVRVGHGALAETCAPLQADVCACVQPLLSRHAVQQRA